MPPHHAIITLVTTKKKILVLIGTRPECIKLAPLVYALQNANQFEVTVCLTSQHKQMLQQALRWFPLPIHHDLNVMTDGQQLPALYSRLLAGINSVIDQVMPDMIIVQGDTTTALAGATAAFMHDLIAVHLEAGLRTYNRRAPWPEETNRAVISRLALIHLAPTQQNADVLLSEKVDGIIEVVGNTVIDALLDVLDRINNDQSIQKDIEASLSEFGLDATNDKFILVTGHRRESFGEGMQDICTALARLAENHKDLKIVYAVHLNPQVHQVVHKRLGNHKSILLMPPLDYGTFVYLMDKSHIILSDSGGIQEEAPSLNKPLLVMRETTERMEAVDCGAVKLVGTEANTIIKAATTLLQDDSAYQRMASVANPFGDGTSSQRVAALLYKCAQDDAMLR